MKPTSNEAAGPPKCGMTMNTFLGALRGAELLKEPLMTTPNTPGNAQKGFDPT